ncbi:MAG: WYL domain-containing protein [Desulfurobacteriaceae bacterium]
MEKRLYLAIEVLKYLSENGNSFISTTEIQDKLTSRGILSGTNPSADRKRLNRTLSDLLQAGYVESRFDTVKGRKPQMWRLNVKAVPYLVSLSEEELLSLFTLISFVPRKYRNLEVLEPGLRAVNRLGKLLDREKKEVAMESFDYLPVPVERFTNIDPETLKTIFRGIVERRELFINYEGNQFTVYPIKVFHYNGIFYLSSYLLQEKRYRHLHIVKMRVYGLGREYPLYYWKRYKDKFFSFSEEPFIMKVELPADYMADLKSEHSVFLYPTQFHIEWDNQKVTVWIVAFSSYRFASWIILDELKAIYPASLEDIEIARERKLKEFYEGLTYNLKENIRRFSHFKKALKNFFEKRMEFYSSLVN